MKVKFEGEARFETGVESQEPFPVASIAFDTEGHMLVAQRGTPETPQDYSRFVNSGASQVLRFTPETADDPQTAALWKPEPQEYAVSNAKGHRAASGGLALQYAYKADGSADLSTCNGSVLMSADALGPERAVHGVQLNGIELVRPANVPPVQSVFVNWDNRQNDAAARGMAGGIAVLQDCTRGGGGVPPVAGGGGAGGEGAASPGDAGGGGAVPGESGGGGETAETPQDEGGGGTTTPPGSLVVAKTASVATCSPKGGCAFNISVSNPTDVEVPGPITIDDQIDAPQAALTGEPNAPWTCTKAAPFTCTHPGPVPANGALDDLRMVFAPNTPAETKEVKNCASLAGAPVAPPAVPNNAALPPPPAPTSSNNGGLKVEVTGTKPSCSPTTGDCEFEIKITNLTGAEITKQPLAIFDTMSVGTQTQAKNDFLPQLLPPGMKCQPKGREFNCTQDELTLAPNASITLKASGKIDTSEGGPASFVTDNVAVTLGPLTGEATASIAFNEPVNVLPEPGAQQADAQQAGGAAVPPSCATIPLDPNAPVQSGPIITAKKGPAKCTPKGPCAFTIAVSNNTDAEIKGPIVIDEQINAPQAALAGDANAPWTCTKAAPFQCTHPGPLAAKQSIDLNISFTPNTPPETKELKNCAVPKQPAAANGGGAADPNVQKQFAPGQQFAPRKKAELAPLLPFRFNSLIGPAAFRPQSFAPGRGLLHLTGGAGGTIGGNDAVQKCLKWTMPKNGFNVTQSNGPQVGFGDLKVAPDGTVTGGTASYISDNGPVTGKVTGTIIGGHVDVKVMWAGTIPNIGHYVGDVGPGGGFSGNVSGTIGGKATFKSERTWFQCSENEECKKYADDALAAQQEFNALHCGAVGPGRWSGDRAEHVSWCMGQSTGKREAETSARAEQLSSCQASDAQCNTFGLEAAAKTTQMKALGCKEVAKLMEPPAPGQNPIASGPDAFKKLCLLNLMKASPDAMLQDIQKQLDACQARIAAGEGPGGIPAGANPDPANANEDPGAAVDPAADPGAGANPANPAEADPNGQAEPAPEQCVVVQLDPDAPQPEPAPVNPEDGKPSNAGKLTLFKKAAENVACQGNKCSFVIDIHNDTAELFSDFVEFDDTVFADGAASGEAAVVVLPGGQAIQCTKGDAGFKCSGKVVIKANTAIQVLLTADVGAGNFKEMRNCANLKDGKTPSCATVPLGAPAKPAQLTLSKNPAAGQCTAVGGGCDFVVTISNPDGAAEFNAPVTFTDHISASDNTPFPNITVGEIRPQPDKGVTGAEVRCVKNGNDITCSTGAASVKIPPGKKIVVPMSFKPGDGAGAATGVRNCAQFDGGEKQCANIPFAESGKPLLRAKKFQVGGNQSSCVPNCSFFIQLSNVGTNEAEGPFVLKDVFTATNGMDSIKVIGEGDFACSTTNGVTGCISTNKGTNKLAPGATLTGVVQVSATTPSTEYKNCVVYDPNAQAKPSPFDLEAGPLCATIKDRAHDRANIGISIIAPNAEGPDGIGKCALNSPCRFAVKLFSNGVKPYLSVPMFNATISPNSVSQITALPGWNCGVTFPGKSMLCSDDAIPSLSSPDFVTQEISVVAGPGWVKNARMTMCVSLTGKIDAFDNFHGDNDACATVILDPFNVKVEKTGDQTCELGGECHFNLTLFNPGPIDHDAPVTMSDKLTGLSSAEIVSISPPLPCATQPTKIPFTCTSPSNIDLPLGSPPKVFSMVIRLPNDASAKQFTNCAEVAGARSDLKDAGNQSCVTVKTKPPEQPIEKVVTISKSAVTEECGEDVPCAFVVTLHNESAQPIAGPISFYDVFSAGTQPMTQVKLAVSPPAPWTCVASAAPGMQCSHPGPLPPNGSLSLSYAMQPLPGSLANVTSLTNCANYEGARRVSSCANMRVKQPQSQEPLEIVTPPPGRCFGDMELIAGMCRCPPPKRYKRGACVDDGDGGGGWNGVDQRAEPPPGRVRPPIVLPPPRRDTEPPRCARGWELRRGVCRPRRVPGTDDGDGGADRIKPGDDTSPPKKVTPPPPPPPPKCPRSAPFGEPGNCCERPLRRGICPPAKGPDPGPVIKPPPMEIPYKTCPNGKRVYGKYSQCPNDKPVRHCPNGYRVLDKPNKYGAYCELIPKPTPPPVKPPPVKPPPVKPPPVKPPPVKPPPVKPPPVKPPPQKPHCTGGKVNRATDGACVCPSGFVESGGKCVLKGPA